MLRKIVFASSLTTTTALFFYARVLFLFHLLAIAVILIGTFLAIFGRLKRGWFELTYFLFVIGTILSSIIFKACILTLWEQKVLYRIDPALSYKGGFISHYLAKLGIHITASWITIIFFSLFIIGLWNWWRSRRNCLPDR